MITGSDTDPAVARTADWPATVAVKVAGMSSPVIETEMRRAPARRRVAGSAGSGAARHDPPRIRQATADGAQRRIGQRAGQYIRVSRWFGFLALHRFARNQDIGRRRRAG